MKKEIIFLVVVFLSLFPLWGIIYGASSVFPNETAWFGSIRHAHGGAFVGAGYILGVLIIHRLDSLNIELLKNIFSLNLKSFIFWVAIAGIIWELFELYLYITQGSLFGRAQDVNPFFGIDFPIDIFSDLIGALLVRHFYFKIRGQDGGNMELDFESGR